MPLPRRSAVRLLAGLLLVLALGGGLWWWSSLLNETELKLVGAWEADAQGAFLLLSDRRLLLAFKGSGTWTNTGGDIARWKASDGSFSMRPLPPDGGTLRDWITYARDWWSALRQDAKILRLTDDHFEWEMYGDTVSMRRTTDLQLQDLFHRLNSGSP